MSIHQAPDVAARSSAMIRGSVIERTGNADIVVNGSDATIESVVVRDTQTNEAGQFGEGLGAVESRDSGEQAVVSVVNSTFERNHGVGVSVSGSSATISGSLVRDTQPNDDGRFGRGIDIAAGVATDQRSHAEVRQCLVEGSRNIGIAVFASDVAIEETVVRGTQPDAVGYGRGISIQDLPGTGQRGIATIRSSLVEQNHEVGVAVIGSDVTLEFSEVRGTQPNSSGAFGDGLAVLGSADVPAAAFIRATRFEANVRAALSNFGASVTFGSNRFECSAFALEGEDYGGASFVFEHLGGNVCGCPNAGDECQVLSGGLEAPPPVESLATER